MRNKLLLLLAMCLVVMGLHAKTMFIFSEEQTHYSLAYIEDYRHLPPSPAQGGESRLCKTPSMICELPQPVPIGSTCWCIGPSGPIKGIISEN